MVLFLLPDSTSLNSEIIDNEQNTSEKNFWINNPASFDKIYFQLIWSSSLIFYVSAVKRSQAGK